MKRTLTGVSLRPGCHETREEGVCAMEAAAWLAGEPHSDKPKCVSLMISRFMRSWNDALPNNADRDRLLLPLIPRILNTATGLDDDRTRSYLAMDWLVRVCTVSWLEVSASLEPYAQSLSGCEPIVSAATFSTAEPLIAAARSAARAAVEDAAGDAVWSAARAAARSAVEDAARAAARSAAEDAAWDAARVAARDAARVAVWAAASGAAWESLRPTVARLQKSAADLVTRMCEVGRC